ncbi:MAG: hypothetical protein JXR10_15765 [Cyclobacteriaceae bacterium]
MNPFLPFIFFFFLNPEDEMFNQEESLFEGQEAVASLKNRKLDEASGLEYSIKNPNHFWSHNDSGGNPSIFLFDTTGQIVMEVRLTGVDNRDWEEITLEETSENSFIYIADFGDNKSVRPFVNIFRIEEPVFEGEDFVAVPANEIEKMRFKYKEGARDAEALMFDYSINELVLVTKRERNTLIYSFPFDPNESVVSSLGSIPSRGFTAADASMSGEILLKNYKTIYYWPSDSQGVADRILQWKPTKLSYSPEPQGEAVCWAAEDFYTISERNGKDQKLLYYKRK